MNALNRKPMRRSAPTGLSAALVTVSGLVLTGCMNLSGLGGESKYACKAPEGVTCDSVSGTYANAVKNNLPSQRRAAAATQPAAVAAGAAEGAGLGAGLGSGVIASVTAGVAPVAISAAGHTSRPPTTSNATTTTAASPLAMPLRSSARILRLWFKPWEDADRDLYDQGYVYVQIDNGQWLIEHAQRQIRDAYAPLRPPPRSTAPASELRDATAAAHKLLPQFPGLVPPPGRHVDPD